MSIWDRPLHDQLVEALEREATLRTCLAYIATFKGANPDDWDDACYYLDELAEMAEAALAWEAGDPLPPEVPTPLEPL